MCSCLRQVVLSLVIPLCFNLVFTTQVSAMPFGIYDPRALAMGGAGVAVASSVNAVFYNPAILSTYSVLKEKAHNQAFSFPITSIRLSSALETLIDQRNINYESNITESINTYNANQGPTTAQAALTEINSLNNILGYANNLLMLDASASLVVAVPSQYQGGAFFVSHRGVGDGQLNIPAADIALLNDYQEALQFAISGEGDPHNELYTDGNLGNPTGNISAEANARFAVITELGIGLSRQLKVFGSDYSVGITPKMVQVTTYDYHRTITDNVQDKEGTKDDDWQANLDVGVLKKISARWRVGLVAKNLIERRYPSATGEDLTISPQWRLGVAHYTPLITYTVDLDLLANDGVYPGNASQFLLSGMEIKQGLLRYRLGYRHSIDHQGPREDGVFSVGLGLNGKTLYFDMAYSENQQQRAGSLMLGFHF